MAKTSGGLGKGINALFGDIPEVEEENAENSIQMIPIGSIDPNKNQPRKQFAPEALDQLAASIRSVGVIQPIILAPNGKRYTIVAGERVEALNRVTLEIPCPGRPTPLLLSLPILG